MCGIAGWVDPLQAEIDETILPVMLEDMTHRGPDGSGIHREPHSHMGHRRLSIIDVEGGKQPLANETSTIWLTFNGEIFNFKDLRSDLIKRGHQFRTDTDTEVIVHLYEDVGEDCVNHLRGQFAFAIWDTRKRALFLARDRLGEKPLYYARIGNRIAYASTIRSLLRVPGVSTELDPNAVAAYFQYGYVPESMCVFRDIRKLPAATTAVFSDGELTQQRYWRPNRATCGARIEFDEIDELLYSATRLRMISDVPLGAFLSGGVDSSLVVSYMRRATTGPIRTYTIGFEEADHDEREFARLVANRFETEHTEYVVTPNAIDLLPKLTHAFDEPFADSSALAMYMLSDLAGKEVTVALNGDGGDEVFGGYLRYKRLAQCAMLQSLPKWLQQTLSTGAKCASAMPFHSEAIKLLARWHQELKVPIPTVYESCVSTPCASRVRLTDAFHESCDGGTGIVASAFADAFKGDSLYAASCADLVTYLPGDLLVKADRATMANSVEARSPFVDHVVVERGLALASSQKLRRGQLKYPLTALLERELPRSFVRRKKSGFAVPVDRWFRSELKPLLYDAVEDSRLCVDGVLDQDSVKTVRDEHLSRRADHKRQLWAFLCMELWYREVSQQSHLIA